MSFPLTSLKLQVNKLLNQYGNSIPIDKNKDLILLLKKDKEILRNILLFFQNKTYVSYREVVVAILNCSKDLKQNVDFAYEVLSYDIGLLDLFPLLKNKYKIKLLILAKSPHLFKDYNDWHDEKQTIIAVRFNPLVYRYIPENLKNNKEIIKAALNSSVLHSEKNGDKIEGIYFDIPLTIRNEKNITMLALKNYPSIYKNLDIKNKEDNEIILTALKKGFYEKNVSEFYSLRYIIPHIPNSFYKDIDNIKSVISGFESNLEEAKFYKDCAVNLFCGFIKESSKVNIEAKCFFERVISKKFEIIIKNYGFESSRNFYSDDISNDIDEFFNKSLPLLCKKLESFLLQKKISDNLCMPEFYKETKGKI